MSVLPRMPHSRDAERAILGSIILGSDRPGLEEGDFYFPFHQMLYRILRCRKEAGKPTSDLVLLAEELSSTELDQAGGVEYFAGLLDGLPRVCNASYYAEIVKIKAILRKKIALCELMGERLRAANGDAADVLRDVAALSSSLRDEVEQKRILGFKTGMDLASIPNLEITWIAKGLVAKGAITELGAKVKTGKTTLIMEMIQAVLNGRTFLDLPTVKTPVVYLSEQPAVSFRKAAERANLLGREDFVFLLFCETQGLDWPQVCRAAISECKKVGASLLVVDTLSQFAGLTGDRENNSGDALEAMRPLQQAVTDDIGVVVIRHERKSGGDVGDSGRGSSAFAGVVDIVLSLRKQEGTSAKNRRLLQSVSRFSETPSGLLIELSTSEYLAIGERHETALKDAHDTTLRISPKTEAQAATLEELVRVADLSRATVARAIDKLIREHQLYRVGHGKRGDPFRYFRPENCFSSTSHIGESSGQKLESPSIGGHQ